MNTNSLSARVVKGFVAVAAAVVLFVNPLTSKAEGGAGSKKSSINEQNVSVKYAGTTENSIVFKVEFENPTADKFWLIIKNDEGDIVYHQQFSDVHFSKSVFFQNMESDIHPVFVIRSSDNSEVVRQFQVTKTLTENTTVTKL